MSKEYKFGVVGTGIFATDTHLPTFKKLGYLKPTACYNRTKSKAEVFAGKAGIDPSKIHDSLEDVFQDESLDFVDALLPVQYNLDAVKLAVKHNKPIVLEKPIAANMDQAREIVKIAETSDLPIGILENIAFLKSIGIVKDLLPKIGEVVSFTYSSTGPFNQTMKYLTTSWRQKPEHIGGYLSDGGVHQLTMLTEILGPVKSISALTKQVREQSGDDDILFSTMSLESGAIGSFIYGSAFGATEKSSKLIIYGTNGSINFDFSKKPMKPVITYQTGPNAENMSEKTTINVDDEVDPFVEEFANFADALAANDKSKIVVPPRKAFHHLAIVAAALESSKKNGDSVLVEKP